MQYRTLENTFIFLDRFIHRYARMSLTSASFFLVAISIAVCWAGQDASQNRLSDVDPRSARTLLSNNFESGSADPWYDNSPSSVHWIVEDFYYPAEVSNPPPTPLSGTKYLRATRNSQLSAAFSYCAQRHSRPCPVTR
jgi:hypothetical protein